MIKFPYGISDFYSLITEGYFYVDRTGYIRDLENMGKHLMFLRPRRFGKSLWLTTLANYYDLARAQDYEKLFGTLAIAANPTPLHNTCFILEFDFSCVATYGTVKDIERSLFNSILSALRVFCIKYKDFLPATIALNPDDPMGSFKELLAVVSTTAHKIYLLVDEYDNFANDVLASAGTDRYLEIVGSNSLLKYIFREIKAATKGSALERVFATGVTPVVMSDITSGANIFLDISKDVQFSALCGFTQSEIEQELAAVCGQCGFSEARYQETLGLVQTWYNGYRFHLNQSENVYNPTLSIYFFHYLQMDCAYPSQIMDANLAPDEDKLDFIQRISGGEQLITDLVQGDVPITISRLADKFGLKVMLSDRGKDRIFLASFLWYSGVLTIDRQNQQGKIVFSIPNLVIHKLYLERMRENLLPTPLARDDAVSAAESLCHQGSMDELARFVESRIFPVYSNRDLRHANELTIKTLFMALLFNDTFYIMMSEREQAKGYPDLALVVRPDCRKFQILDIVIEFKYIALNKLGLRGEALRNKAEDELRELGIVKQELADARAQARRYAQDLSRELTLLAPTLAPHKWVVVSLGLERLLWEAC